MRKGDNTHIRHRGELTDLPHMGAEESVAAQAGLHVMIVVVGELGLAGTSACSACPDTAKEHLAKISGHWGWRGRIAVRTDGARLRDLVEFKWVEIIFDMNRRLFEYDFAKESVMGGRRGRRLQSSFVRTHACERDE
jgi:hypothetical protein